MGGSEDVGRDPFIEMADGWAKGTPLEVLRFVPYIFRSVIDEQFECVYTSRPT